MKVRILLTVALVTLVALAAVLANRYIPLGRDLIFYSDDVTGFTLSNGMTLQTNKWYFRDDVLAEGQEFFTSSLGLGIMDPTVEGNTVTSADGEAFAVTVGDTPGYLRIPKMHTTITDPNFMGTVVGEEYVRPEGYDEYWVEKLPRTAPGESAR